MKTRFITSIIETARITESLPLPWTRGAARAAMLPRRKPEAAREEAKRA